MALLHTVIIAACGAIEAFPWIQGHAPCCRPYIYILESLKHLHTPSELLHTPSEPLLWGLLMWSMCWCAYWMCIVMIAVLVCMLVVHCGCCVGVHTVVHCGGRVGCVLIVHAARPPAALYTPHADPVVGVFECIPHHCGLCVAWHGMPCKQNHTVCGIRTAV